MRLILVCQLLLPFSCFAFGQRSPTPEPSKMPVASTSAVEQVKALAADSDCAKYAWKSRGKAPIGFVQGHALLYARAACQPNPVLLEKAGSAEKDVLAHYGLKGEPLLSLYTLMVGAAMRESSGKHCEGVDTSNPTSTGGETAEAGLYQTSWNARSSHASLAPMLGNWKGDCLLEVFNVGTKCSKTSFIAIGSGQGAAFQKKAKSCPAFATDFAAVTFRKLKNHYGPLKRKEAEYLPACQKMLEAVGVIAKGACAEFK